MEVSPYHTPTSQPSTHRLQGDLPWKARMSHGGKLGLAEKVCEPVFRLPLAVILYNLRRLNFLLIHWVFLGPNEVTSLHTPSKKKKDARKRCQILNKYLLTAWAYYDQRCWFCWCSCLRMRWGNSTHPRLSHGKAKRAKETVEIRSVEEKLCEYSGLIHVNYQARVPEGLLRHGW